MNRLFRTIVAATGAVGIALTVTACGGGKHEVSRPRVQLSTSTTALPLPLTVLSRQYVENRSAVEPMTIGGVNAPAGALVVIFVASDGPGTTAQTISGVSGAGLTWTRAVQANGQNAAAEIWWSTSTAPISNATIAVTRTLAGCNTGICNGLLGAFIIEHADPVRPVGATGANSQLTGAPKVSLTTVCDDSWVFGVGADWSHALERTIGPGQTMGHDDKSIENDDEYWIQYMTDRTPASGTVVELSDIAPTDHRFDMAAIEVCPTSGGARPQPSG